MQRERDDGQKRTQKHIHERQQTSDDDVGREATENGEILWKEHVHAPEQEQVHDELDDDFCGG